MDEQENTQKGFTFERNIAAYISEHDLPAKVTPRGVTGLGDLLVDGYHHIWFEVKNYADTHRGVRASLAGYTPPWLRRVGVVNRYGHHDIADQLVIMTLGTFLEIVPPRPKKEDEVNE